MPDEIRRYVELVGTMIIRSVNRRDQIMKTWRNRVIRQIVAFVALGATFGLIGCGKGDPHNRQPVSGTVSVNGKPVVFGNISFEPLENQPTRFDREIVDGKFSVNQAGGLAPGKYLVRVQGWDGKLPPVGDNPGEFRGPMPKVMVPEKYGASSKETVTIKAGDKNELTIDLKN
jgi:hypothetical protein